MKQLRYPALLLISAFSVLAACGRDDPAGPEVREGVARFDYTGDQGGAYEAIGEFRLLDSNTLQAGSWAVAGRDAAGELTVLGFSSPTGSRGTLLILPLGNITQQGTVSLACTGTGCPRAGVIFNAVALGSRTATETLYGFTQGTVTIDTLTQTRIAGSFSGQASFYDLNFVPNPTRTVTVINGRFGVPIRDDL